MKNESTYLTGILKRAFVGLVLVTCLRVWTGPVALESTVRAQLPDSAAQRKQILDEARRTNQLLAEIKAVLEHGTLNVRNQSADNSKGVPASKGPPDK